MIFGMIVAACLPTAAVILWVIYVHDDFDGHGRAAWRWLTGRTLKDAVPQYDLDWWNRAVEFENIDLGAHVIPTRTVRLEDSWPAVREWWKREYEGLGSAIDTLHDSTMMARIDKGVQAEAEIIPYWADMSEALPRAVPHTIDPYVWHDVADLIQQARHV